MVDEQTAAEGVKGHSAAPLWKRCLVVGVVVFIALTACSYAFSWSWTGFSGNGTLWDWLSLFLLPIAVALVPLFVDSATRHVAYGLAASALVLAILLVGGYGLGWTWTGFQGNTLWDWLHLLLLPVTLPLAVKTVSAARPRGGSVAARPANEAEHAAPVVKR